MHEITQKVQLFLAAANRGEVEIPQPLVEQYSQMMLNALTKHFSIEDKRKFTLRMSNFGRPLCQLWHEKNGTPSEPMAPFDKMKFLYGDVTEALAVAIMSAAGVDIASAFEHVTFEGVNGTYDLTIRLDNGQEVLYDVKSASAYSFAHKFSKTFEDFADHDDFGYVGQGFGYAEAKGVRFGGWIAINKNDGDMVVLETPDDPEVYEQYRQTSLAKLRQAKESLEDGASKPQRLDDVPETWYRKETGNRVLGVACSFCPFKFPCWPELKFLPALLSDAANPKMVFYTHVDDHYKGKAGG